MNKKYGECDLCTCPGKLSFMDELDLWLCHDCQEEYRESDRFLVIISDPKIGAESFYQLKEQLLEQLKTT